MLVVLGAGALALLSVRIAGALSKRAGPPAVRGGATVEGPGAPEAPPLVEVIGGRVAQWHPAVALEGSLLAGREADIGFQTAGRLAQIAVNVGEVVTQGQVLAALATREAQQQLAAASAQLAAARAQSALAADSARRTASVVKSKALSPAAGVQAEKQWQLAAAQARAARAQRELVRSALAHHTLRAPFAGTVTRVPGAPGPVVAAGAPLFHLADLATLKLVGTIRGEDAELVKTGATVEIHRDDGPAALARGVVAAVVPALDAITKRVPVEAIVTNDGARHLLAGEVVRATIRVGEALTVLAFPPSVLRPGTRNQVLAVRDGKMWTRTITYATGADGTLLVRDGVGKQDLLVIAPWPEASDGQPVSFRQRANHRPDRAGEPSGGQPAARTQR